MQEEFEWQIQQSLKEYKSLDLAIDDLLRKWLDRGADRQSTRQLFRFLYISGYRLTLCSKLSDLVKKNIEPPYHFLFKLYLESSTPIGDASLDQILSQATRNDLQEISKYETFEDLHPKLKKLRENLIAKEFHKKTEKKQQVLKKIEILKQENMLEEERKLFEKLLWHYGQDKEILKAFEDFNLRYADKIFSKPKENKSTWQRFKQLLVGEKNETTDYEKIMISLAKEEPQLSHIIAVSLSLSGAYESALDILQTKELSSDEEWIYLGLLHSARRDLICLQYAQNLERKYLDQPNKMMSCIYYQALSLHRLGEYSKAISLLEIILDYDSDFKLAKDYHREWSEV